MKVTLIEYTKQAKQILAMTRAARLGKDYGEALAMSDADLESVMVDMAKTIPTPWEFVSVTFLIEGVSQATARQMTRNRHGSYAVMSQRVVNATEMGVVNPFDPTDPLHATFAEEADSAVGGYNKLIQEGAALEDARGILPMNTACDMMARYNLRTFVEMLVNRGSYRTQEEHAEVIKAMYWQVFEVWPWIDHFFTSKHDRAIDILSDVIEEIGITPGSGPGWNIAKAIDLIKTERPA